MRVLSGRLLQQPPLTTQSSYDRIFVRDLILDCHLGVYPEEQGVTQRVGFTVEACVAPDVHSTRDEISDVPSYDDLSNAIKDTLAAGHINLVETIAERVCERILQDKRIVSVRMRIDKLERGPSAVGVEITRPRNTAQLSVSHFSDRPSGDGV
ncbi:MAG: dihydroneopterin aldolase [Pseudomonadota bacterium]